MFPVLFSLGPMTITSYGVLAVVAFFTGAFVVWKKGREEHFEEEALFDVSLLLVFWSLVVARIWYIAGHFGDFGGAVLKWVMLVRNPGLAVEGGVLGGLVALVLYCRHRRLGVWEMMDVVAMGAMMGQVVLFLAAFLNGSGYGVRTQLPWAVTFPGVEGARHPTQLYGLGLSGLCSLLLFRVFGQYRTYDWYKLKGGQAASGLVANVYFAGLGLVMVMMGLLQPTTVVWKGVDVRVWWGLLGMLVGIVLGYWRSGREVTADVGAVKKLLSQWPSRKAATAREEKAMVEEHKPTLGHKRQKRSRKIMAGIDVK